MKKVIPALALVVLAGCGRPPAAAVEQAPAPVLSGTRTAEIVAAYDQANNEVNAVLNADGLARIEAPPLRTGSEAWLRIVRQRGQTVPLITSSGTRFTVPSEGQWFVASANRVRGGVPSPRPTWTVFSEQNGQWLATYSLTPQQDPPSVAVVNSAGAATAVTEFGDLVLNPAQLGQSILDHYVRNLEGKDAFARSPALDDQLANGYRVGQNVLRGKGRLLERKVNPAVRHPMYAVRAEDGGVLVFTAATVVDVVRASAPGGSVTFEASTNEGALLGRTATAPRFTITRLQTFLTHIPPTASSAQVTVLAYGDTPISVSTK